MTKASSKKRSSTKTSKKTPSAKYEVVIKAKATSTWIVDINNEIVTQQVSKRENDISRTRP
jgi:hypothetical protein